MVGLHGDVIDLYIEVLSWPIMDILNQDNPVKVMSLSQPATLLILNIKKHLHFKVAMLLQLPKMIQMNLMPGMTTKKHFIFQCYKKFGMK